MLRKEKEAIEKIPEVRRFRKMAIIGLVIGVPLIVLGQLLSFSAFFIIGYTALVICVGITSFLTVLNWQYTKALKTEAEKETKPQPMNVCPRCGTEVEKNIKYCPKCGKKVQIKKH